MKYVNNFFIAPNLYLCIMSPTYDSIKAAYAKLKYPFKPFNIFGIRAKEARTNDFNDLLGYIDDKGNFACFNATTDPGRLAEGTATMKAGFYPAVYTFGFHKSNPKHPCLKQTGKAEFYRVKNGKQFDENTVFSGIIGANIHSTRPDFTPEQVNDFSKGCQVIRRWMSHLRFLAACRQSGIKSFDYTLFREVEV